MVSVAATQLCYYSTKATQTIHKQMSVTRFGLKWARFDLGEFANPNLDEWGKIFEGYK